VKNCSFHYPSSGPHQPAVPAMTEPTFLQESSPAFVLLCPGKKSNHFQQKYFKYKPNYSSRFQKFFNNYRYKSKVVPVFYYMPYYKGIWMGGNIPDTNLGTRPS
jgi:hypothetical protein